MCIQIIDLENYKVTFSDKLTFEFIIIQIRLKKIDLKVFAN